MDETAMDTTTMEAGALPDADGMIEPTMDDLFGEGADGLGVALPSIPLPAALVQRLAEMQNSGSCTKLSWSNSGCLAEISPDGRRVGLRCLLRDARSGTWSLSEEPKETKQCILAPKHSNFVHLGFSTLGQDLAIADSLGSVYLFTASPFLTWMLPAPGNLAATDEGRSGLNDIVGLQWLPMNPTDFKNPYITPASKIDDTWSTQMKIRDQNMPRVHHPAEGRNALVQVSRRGKLSLLYQQDIQGWQVVTIDLDSVSSSADILSHAAFCDNEGNLLLVTHDHARRFRLYRITVSWNASQTSRQGSTYSTVAPTLDIGYLTALENISPEHSEAPRLTHLELLPAVDSVLEQHATSLTTVLAAFVHAPLPAEPDQPHQDAFTVLARWHVENHVPTLHDSFGKLKFNVQTAPTTSPVIVLRRQPDVIWNGAVMSMSSQVFDTLLTLVGSDGSVHFRERSTLNTIEHYADTTFISSLAQSGLEHTLGEHSLHLATSPDASAVACSGTKGGVELKLMALRYGWQMLEHVISDTKAMLETAIVCLARQYAMLSLSSSSCDEVLALLPPDLSLDLREKFVKEIVGMLKRSTDFALLDAQPQQMTALREVLLPRALSVQLLLGIKPKSTVRTVAGQLACAVLNSRHICMSLAQSLNRPENARPDIIYSLRGIFRYGADLIVSIVEGIMAARRNATAGISAKQMLEQHVTASGSPAIHLLLCSFSRALLRFQTMYHLRYQVYLQQALNKSRAVLERQQLLETLEFGKELPFKPQIFEQLLKEVDAAVKNAYTINNVSDRRRNEIELAMLTECSFPEELESVLQTLLATTMPKLEENVDGGKLYFMHTEWLGLTYAVSLGGYEQYDVIRKTQLSKGMKLRVCRRCGSKMEDIPLDRMRELHGWLAVAQRHCICNGNWILV